MNARKKIFLAVAMLAAAALVIIYTVMFERYWIAYHEVPVRVPGLPAAFDGFRIQVIADVHAGYLMPPWWVRHVLDSANARPKDMIALVGDYVHGRNMRGELDSVYPLLGGLSAPAGVYAVNGNHDHWADETHARALLERSGRMIENRFVLIRRGDAVLAVAGLGDFTENRSGIDAIEGIPPDATLIVLAHNPDSAEMDHRRRVDLYICGHTHGGQIRIPLADYAPVLPVANRHLDAGIRRTRRDEQVFISRGIGWAILPVRFNCRPEIPVLVLRSQ